MARHFLVSLTTPRPGREDAYNEWFDTHHVPEMLRIDGFVSAQRFGLSEAQRRPPPYPYTYMAMYEIETDDLPATMAALASNQPGMTPSDSGDPDRRAILVVEPLGPKRTAPLRSEEG